MESKLMLWSALLVLGGFKMLLATGDSTPSATQPPTTTIAPLVSSMLMQDMFVDQYLHFPYVMEGAGGDGEGELWLSFDKGYPRIRLETLALSRYGHGKVTLVLDPLEDNMYFVFDFAKMKEPLCVIQPFGEAMQGKDGRPTPSDPSHLSLLKQREQRVDDWFHNQTVDNVKASDAPLSIEWSPDEELRLGLSPDHKQVNVFELRKNGMIVKRLWSTREIDALPTTPQAVLPKFEKPAMRCAPAVEHPHIVVAPPKNSALRDLLTLIKDEQRGGDKPWPHLFTLLSALLVPDDFANLPAAGKYFAAVAHPTTTTQAPMHGVEKMLHHNMFVDKYLHFPYVMTSQGGDGAGQIWISFDNGYPRIRLESQATSAQYGAGKITLVLDPMSDNMYFVFEMEKMQQPLCVTYPFEPELDPKDGRPQPVNPEHLKLLRQREKEVEDWVQKEGDKTFTNETLSIQWTPDEELRLALSPDHKQVNLFELRRHGHLVKRLWSLKEIDVLPTAPKDSAALFAAPGLSCTPASENPGVVVKPPQSSSLHDLLTLIKDEQRGDIWPHLFTLMTALLVPADFQTLPASGEETPIATSTTQAQPLVANMLQHDMFVDQYLHFGYAMESRGGDGEGQVWFSFDHGYPRIRLESLASSAKWGAGKITLVLDPKSDIMYFIFDLAKLTEPLCVTYPFGEDGRPAKIDLSHLSLLKQREQRVEDWVKAEAEIGGTAGSAPLEIQWSPDEILRLGLSPDHKQVNVFELRMQGVVVKRLWSKQEIEAAAHTPKESEQLFNRPAMSCSPADKHPGVIVKPPDSSALRDLLTVVKDEQRGDKPWPHLLTLLTALLVPSDFQTLPASTAPESPSQEEAKPVVANLLQRDMFVDQYLHFPYVLESPGGDGEGQVWISFDNGYPRIRIETLAASSQYGPGKIKMILDPRQDLMYFIFDFSKMGSPLCVTYPFDVAKNGSRASINPSHLQILRQREQRIEDWVHDFHNPTATNQEPIRLQWSLDETLRILLTKDHKQVSVLELRQHHQIVKRLWSSGEMDVRSSTPEDVHVLFAEPTLSCKPASEEPNVTVKPPDSSALHDLITIIKEEQRRDKPWPHLFVLLSTLLVPGDFQTLPAQTAPMTAAPTTTEAPAPLGPTGLTVADLRLFGAKYVHGQYSVTFLANTRSRMDHGHMWLSLDQGYPRLRYAETVQDTTRFGPGTITMLIDPGTDVMYIKFDLRDLSYIHCIEMPYPRRLDAIAMEKLVQRKKNVDRWLQEEPEGELGLPTLDWSASNLLEFRTTTDGQYVTGIDTRDGHYLAKRMIFQDLLDLQYSTPKDAEGLFKTLSPDWTRSCMHDTKVAVDLVNEGLLPDAWPSSMKHLLYMMKANQKGGTWPDLLVFLSALTVPGDVEKGVVDKISENQLAAALSQPGEKDVALQFMQTQVFVDKYMHTHYQFSLQRDSMRRSGEGNFWFSFDNDLPRLRLEGLAESPRFGMSKITLVVDPRQEVLYAVFDLEKLHHIQCVMYPFPSARENPGRLERLKLRKKEVEDWMNDESKTELTLPIQWSSTYKLEFQLSADKKQVTGLDFRQGDRIVKQVKLDQTFEQRSSTPQDVEPLFEKPMTSCQPSVKIDNPLAQVELKPPNMKSSALNDLLLVMKDKQKGGDWPHLFILLSALMVPGDVAVLIEDPAPPALDKLSQVAFSYVATVLRGPQEHKSYGRIWLDLDQHEFRLQGVAKETEVGPLTLDIVGSQQHIYSSLNLTAEVEQQCVSYEYPGLDTNTTKDLEAAAQSHLIFYNMAELDGEDCAVFVASLTRGRLLFLWFDLENAVSERILRTEVRHRAQVYRSTAITSWEVGPSVGELVKPQPEWHCSEQKPDGRLARLGLERVHTHSIQLQDAFYAIHKLPKTFALLEVLALTGDVSILVQVPKPPQFFELPALSFNYRIFQGPAADPKIAEDGHWATGNFATNYKTGAIRLTTQVLKASAMNLTIALEPVQGTTTWTLAVLLNQQTGAAPICASMPVEVPVGPSLQEEARLGLFMGVDAIGEDECNHFMYSAHEGTGPDQVDFWFSEEADAVCRMEVHPPALHSSGLGSLVAIPAWEVLYLPPEIPGMPREVSSAGPLQWGCQPVDPSDPWLTLGEQPRDPEASSTLPSVQVATQLIEALSFIGITPTGVGNLISRLVIGPSSSTADDLPPLPKPTGTQLSIMSQDLQSFSFSYASSHPSYQIGGKTVVPSQRGTGELRVDLAKGRLFLRSEAFNVSAGIPYLESRVIFRGDRSQLLSRTRMPESKYEGCWAVQTPEVFTPLRTGPWNPFLSARPGTSTEFPGTSQYNLHLSQTKTVEIYSTPDGAPVHLKLRDAPPSATASVEVKDWSTEAIDDRWFEPGADWNCESTGLPIPEAFAEWELLKTFFGMQRSSIS